MPINIEMPKLSDTMTEGTVVRWLKKVGDEVEIGDEIAEIETDKATMAMEAFDEGTITEILVEEGGAAPVGATLAVLREEGEEVEPAEAETTAVPDDGEPFAPALEAPPAAQSAAPSQVAPASQVATPAPAAAQPAPPAQPTPATQPSAPVSQPAPPAQAAPAPGSADRIKASPLAKKMAEASGLDLATVQGSGPGGRIVRKDIVEATGGSASRESATAPSPDSASKPVAAPAPQAPQTAPAAEPAPAPKPAPIQAVATGEDQKIELSTLRRIIADRLLASKTTIPHFYLHVEADAASLMDIRKQVNEQAEATHGNKYTVNDFILKAVINALQVVPAVNASFNGDHIVQFAKIGVAVAVAVEDGLVTPVVKDAAEKSLLQISRQVKDLATRARDGKLLPNEFDGGTFTVSNLGAYGVEAFDAIINPPQAAILSVGAITEKAVVADGKIVPGLRMDLGLSCDHRVVDGAIGAQFLAQVKKLIENPALMLV